MVWLAEKSGVSIRSIVDYMNEKPGVNPRPATAAQLANALGLTFKWLAYGEGAATDRPSRPYIADSENGHEQPRGTIPMPPPRPLVAMDGAQSYAASLPPLDVCIAALARHLSIEERTVRDFVVAQMTRKST